MEGVASTMRDNNGNHASPNSNYQLQQDQQNGITDEFVDEMIDSDDDSYYYDDDSDVEEEGEAAFSLQELLYSMSSFHAIVRPVSVTMILSATAACFVNTPQLMQQTAEEFSVYQVWKIDSGSSSSGSGGSSSSSGGGDSTSANFFKSIGNTFVMVTVIGMMTFGIVLLYKYRCMKCLIGYMVLSSAMLLGFMGSVMSELVLYIYQIPMDIITYYVGHYNFAIVGVLSIFFAKELGIPNYITQGYLICSSVILAWHFSHFDEWTAWTLLVMLALYDLCAVLTPCGPLKALVNLMQQDEAPEMPGLLYEAKINVRRPTPRNNTNDDNNESTRNQSADVYQDNPTYINNTNNEPAVAPAPTSLARSSNSYTEGTVEMTTSNHNRTKIATTQPTTNQQNEEQQQQSPAPRIITIPLALAIVYKLPVLASSFPKAKVKKTKAKRGRSIRRGKNDRAASNSPLLGNDNDDLLSENEWKNHAEYAERNFSVIELLHNVQIKLAKGNIQKVAGKTRNGNSLYQIMAPSGQIRRTLQVNKRNGKVYEVVANEDGYETDDDEDEEGSNSIRLGLGDFIFYSVLVAKAALYSFTTFAACMLVILAGLGGTLVLLSVYHSALPALPISIFLGVVFYGLTRVAIEPWIENVMQAPLYV